MAAVFPPQATLVGRAILLGCALLAIAGVGWWWLAPRTDWSRKVGFTITQPVPFSHQHHVAGLGIDCRFCHASVEVSANAGLPPTWTCMTCHSQIWTNAALLAPVRDSLAKNRPLVWGRVTNLPDYVYFNHAIHIAKGVGCASCHGQVDADAADLQSQIADDAILPGLPSRPWPSVAAGERDLRHNWTRTRRHAVAGRVARALPRAGPRSDGLLDMPPVSRGPNQWRGQAEDAERMAREFPALASALARPESRRRVLRLMAASMALGGLTGCDPSAPDETYVSAVTRPRTSSPGCQTATRPLCRTVARRPASSWCRTWAGRFGSRATRRIPAALAR